ncbi:MAG: UDP-glucose 4-epimerase GalE [Bacteroidetes bacterium]|nr:MAG: UDP-glucose 4-epimerase GalE [Bacteroidota bacterium]REK05158.1 MAG: UDP-glucose 4-epimerase GalE [Bacteroidota bacterium]REK32563.1 MAG: UDP-glucose 4-epimerase GalE [Bacteroidota bacterium]REK48990.1 MAG: UDP-glucose 4-epimerase GalE [Bacteroidota bacterium]
MNVLVTGGTGYIGSHTTVELINRGYTPILVDNLSNSREEVIQAIEKITGKGVTFFNIDLCNRSELKKFFEVYKIEATIHFAAFKAVGESVDFPLKYYRNNIQSLVNLLDLYNEFGLDNFVFSSSCSVYGQNDEQPVSESTPLGKAESPYAFTKQIGEKILSDSIRAYKFKGCSLRYFNPAGSHESALIGEYPLQAPTNLVPVITQTAIGKRKKMQVFGSDYNTPDGTCVRDYIHVMDIASAHVDAITRMAGGKVNQDMEIFNLGTGQGNTVLEVIKTFEKVTGQKLSYEMSPRRPGDVEKVYADTGLANSLLGWKALRNLEDIVKTAWDWEKKLSEANKSIA